MKIVIIGDGKVDFAIQTAKSGRIWYNNHWK